MSQRQHLRACNMVITPILIQVIEKTSKSGEIIIKILIPFQPLQDTLNI